MTHTLHQRLACEGLGSLALTLSVVGSGIMAERLSGGNAAVALLGNTLAICTMLFVLIAIFRPVSGAHLNPVVSLIAVIEKTLPANVAALYVLVQVVAAIAGTWLAHALFGHPILQLSHTARTGPSQWLSEGVASFGLAFTIFAAHKADKTLIPAAISLYVFTVCWCTGSAAFLNPALTLARSLTDSFTGIRPIDTPAFIMAQVAGGLAALPLCRWLGMLGDKGQNDKI